MNRLEKKCFVFSLSMHGLVAGAILLSGIGFRNQPHEPEPQVMTLIPPVLLDRAGAGGGSPAATINQPPQQMRSVPQPAQTAPPQPRREQTHERVERHKPEPQRSEEVAVAPAPRTHKAHHDIHPDYTPVSATTSRVKRQRQQERETSEQESAQRQREIQQAANQLAYGVKNSGAPSTTVDVAGISGGQAFAGYRDVIFNAYYHAWITPDSVTDRTASADAKITVARDGAILSAEIIRSSGNATMDKSVERALRTVTKLPAFPATARDEQRTFTIQFSLESKDNNG